MAHVLVIGAGIFGTMHAYFALKAGHRVSLIERDAYPASASVRNFGMIAVGGRAAGAELEHALRARELWAEISKEHEELTFRACGSIMVAKTDDELSVMAEVSRYPDSEARDWKLLSRNEAQEINPALQGAIAGGLYCGQDAAVEPETVLSEMRAIMHQNSDFRFLPSTEIVKIVENEEIVLFDRQGSEIRGNFAFVVPGADHSTLFPDLLRTAPLRKVHLQMARLANPNFNVTTSIANADSLRYYPGYKGTALEKLEPAKPIVEELTMQLLLQQRVDGTLTIGDTHVYQEPFPHEMREDAYEYLTDEISAIFGSKAPRVLTRWTGVYSQNTTGDVCVREKVSDRIMVVTGPGGRGNTLAPAIAEVSVRDLLNV